DLKAHLVMHAVSTLQAPALLLANLVVKESPAARQRLTVGGGHLGEMDVGAVPGDDMAGARDAYGQFVILALDGAHGQNIEQLRVQRAPVESKDHVADRRSDVRHGHGIRPKSATHHLLRRVAASVDYSVSRAVLNLSSAFVNNRDAAPW